MKQDNIGIAVVGAGRIGKVVGGMARVYNSRAQCADAAGTDHRNADIVLLHSQPPKRSRAGDRRYATCRTGTSHR